MADIYHYMINFCRHRSTSQSSSKDASSPTGMYVCNHSIKPSCSQNKSNCSLGLVSSILTTFDNHASANFVVVFLSLAAHCLSVHTGPSCPSCQFYFIFFIFFCFQYITDSESEKVVEFQPALITLFNRRNSDELSAKESIKEHLWDIHFAEYGR